MIYTDPLSLYHIGEIPCSDQPCNDVWVAPRQDDQQWQRAAWCLELMAAKHLEADELSKSSAMNHRINGESVFGYPSLSYIDYAKPISAK